MGYTILKVKCLDQTLQLVNAPKLASGGVNEIRMEFEFCPLWQGLAKTAVFYRSPETVYRVLLSNDACVVPPEVLTDPGRLFFGVLGVGETETRTAEVMQLTLYQGPSVENAVDPAEPTPDIYQQILAEMERVRELAEDLLVVGDEAPNRECLWFNTANNTLTNVDADGGMELLYPATKKENVDGLDEFEYAVKAIEVTLAAADWAGGAAPYSQTVVVEGMTADWVPGVPVIVASESMETNQAMQEALSCLSQITSATDTLTFICYEDKPESDIAIRVPGVV